MRALVNKPASRHGGIRGAVIALIAMAALVLVLLPARTSADGCVLDSWDSGTTAVPYLWPNWYRTPVSSYTFALCVGCGYANEIINGLTVVNFGTADNTDIKTVYARVWCDSANGALITLTYAGLYTEDAGLLPAWTWAGASLNLGGCADLCNGCAQVFTIDVYVDIQPCPTEKSTVNMGFPVNWTNNPVWPGSVYDNHGCISPWYDMTSSVNSTIVYVMKEGPNFAAPGDTVDYTVRYGRAGLNPLTSIIVTDSMPAYTHYVYGSAVPAPDLGWDPNPGPPPKLRWTLAGGATAGGRTAELSFSLTVDWGNGESFEPGSGDVGAPEGERLRNTAHVDFRGTSCIPPSNVSDEVRTVVKRYMFWKIGDNDILFAPKIGMPDDEMTYSLFMKNMSASKTWWNVCVWDTVPPEIDVWTPGYGFEDQCVGWTMSPSGCSPGTPGWKLSGPGTILTWKLDMLPQMTLELRWKARVKTTASGNDTATNRASIMELGRSNVVEGTGHAGKPRNFTHVAAIVLRTTYVAYGAYGSSCADSTNAPGQAYHIHFFPLNKMTNFELRKLENCSNLWATGGGASASINVYAGTCVGGFPDGGWPGCKVERIPASYWPAQYEDIFPPFPCHNVYKVTSNSPFIWEEMSNIEDESADRWSWAGSTTLTYSGWMHYSFMQVDYTGSPPGDNFFIFNTDMNNPTTALLFKWEPAILNWELKDIADLDPGAIWECETAPRFNTAPSTLGDSYRVLSSDTRMLVYRFSWNANSSRGIMAPVAETGLLVSKGTLPQRFFAHLAPEGYNGTDAQAAILNIGAVNANYKMSVYDSYGPFTSPVPSGRWTAFRFDNVPAGFANAANPHIYGRLYDAGPLRHPWTYQIVPGIILNTGFCQIEVETPGSALEVLSGWNISDAFAGGCILHDVNGAAFGTDFWFTQVIPNYSCKSGYTELYTVDIFCSSKGMVVTAQSTDGYTAHYTTTGPDQVVSFLKLTGLGSATRRNTRFTLTGTPGMASAQYIYTQISEKYYALPFVSTGIYYNIISPPVVFVGQSFWLTVVVLNTGGGTKTDYTGTSSFSSTDPTALIQAAPMDGYNYVWTGGELGVKVFVNVTFTRLGLQTLVASDTLDGSITGLTTIMVVGADIKLEKRKRLSVSASGDTVQFQICWSNYSSATGYSFTITDAVPNGTTYVPELASAALCGASDPAPSFSLASSTSTTTTPPTNFATVNPGSAAASTTRWLRWTIRDVYVNSTGCVCFKVVVN